MVNETHAASEMTDRHGNKLVQIQVIHRHGARAPSTALNFPSICGVSAYKAFYNFIPNLASDVRLSPSTPKYFNPNEASSCYNGQLSPVGAAQMFALGARLRARYSSILPDEFDESVLVVRSTAMRRTVESAVACLSGMYPNQCMRPLDIEIRTRREETMVGNKRICHKLYQLSKATYSSFHIPASTESRATELLPPLAADASAENRLHTRSHFALALRDIAIALRENGCQAQPWESQELPLAVSQIHKVHSRQTWRLGLGRVSLFYIGSVSLSCMYLLIHFGYVRARSLLMNYYMNRNLTRRIHGDARYTLDTTRLYYQ